jgi:hypothetical protein
MDKLNLDKALSELAVALRKIEIGGTKLAKVHREFINARELALGDYPLVMFALESSAFDSQSDTADVLLIGLSRARDFDSTMEEFRFRVVMLLKEDFGSESSQVGDLELGDLMPGFTESAESPALPDGAFIASWLNIQRPARGFFVRFTITVDTD